MIAELSEIYFPVAWLHDVLEDTNLTPLDLLQKGLPFEVVKDVEILTKRKNENYLEYILRVRGNLIPVAVKLADMKHNSLTATKSQKDKYSLAAYILKEEEK